MIHANRAKYLANHSYAIVTGTPPTICSDASIRAARGVFAGVSVSPQLKHLLGEVELCLIWKKARLCYLRSRHAFQWLIFAISMWISMLDLRFGEWWCLPDPAEKPLESSPSTALNAADVELRAWCSKWDSFISHGSFPFQE